MSFDELMAEANLRLLVSAAEDCYSIFQVLYAGVPGGLASSKEEKVVK